MRIRLALSFAILLLVGCQSLRLRPLETPVEERVPAALSPGEETPPRPEEAEQPLLERVLFLLEVDRGSEIASWRVTVSELPYEGFRTRPVEGGELVPLRFALVTQEGPVIGGDTSHSARHQGVIEHSGSLADLARAFHAGQSQAAEVLAKDPTWVQGAATMIAAFYDVALGDPRTRTYAKTGRVPPLVGGAKRQVWPAVAQDGNLPLGARQQAAPYATMRAWPVEEGGGGRQEVLVEAPSSALLPLLRFLLGIEIPEFKFYLRTTDALAGDGPGMGLQQMRILSTEWEDAEVRLSRLGRQRAPLGALLPCPSGFEHRFGLLQRRDRTGHVEILVPGRGERRLSVERRIPTVRAGKRSFALPDGIQVEGWEAAVIGLPRGAVHLVEPERLHYLRAAGEEGVALADDLEEAALQHFGTSCLLALTPDRTRLWRGSTLLLDEPASAQVVSDELLALAIEDGPWRLLRVEPGRARPLLTLGRGELEQGDGLLLLRGPQGLAAWTLDEEGNPREVPDETLANAHAAEIHGAVLLVVRRDRAEAHLRTPDGRFEAVGAWAFPEETGLAPHRIPAHGGIAIVTRTAGGARIEHLSHTGERRAASLPAAPRLLDEQLVTVGASSRALWLQGSERLHVAELTDPEPVFTPVPGLGAGPVALETALPQAALVRTAPPLRQLRLIDPSGEWTPLDGLRSADDPEVHVISEDLAVLAGRSSYHVLRQRPGRGRTFILEIPTTHPGLPHLLEDDFLWLPGAGVLDLTLLASGL